MLDPGFVGRAVQPEAPDQLAGRLDEARVQLEAYFAGELTEFDLPLDLGGTDFQRRCWLALATIPYGRTVSYGEMEARANRLASAGWSLTTSTRSTAEANPTTIVPSSALSR